MEKNRLACVEIGAKGCGEWDPGLPRRRSGPPEKRLPLMDLRSRRHQNLGDDAGCRGVNRLGRGMRALGAHIAQCSAARDRLPGDDLKARQAPRAGRADHRRKPPADIAYGTDDARDRADNGHCGVDRDLAMGRLGRVVGTGAKARRESNACDTLDMSGHYESSYGRHTSRPIKPLQAGGARYGIIALCKRDNKESAVRLHEYQAKALLARYGLPTPVGSVVATEDEAARLREHWRGSSCVVKAQIHAGARGKAGGVRVIPVAELCATVRQWLGSRLVTAQTGPAGQLVTRVLVEEPVAAASELYLACVVDRRLGRRVILAGTEGGIGIEEGRAPLQIPIDSLKGFQPYQGRALARALHLSGRQVGAFGDLVANLVDLTIATDALLVEINPLMVTAEGALVAADGKIEIDDNALFRQPQLDSERDPQQSDQKDEQARKLGLQYIALDGDIGCLVNGAGLAMATMDLIALAGGRPANFLDVGGGTTAEKVAEALELLVSDGRVKTVLVNIFGGIVRCDLIAEGLVLAARRFGRSLPIVVRLVGTRREEGQRILAQSGLDVDVTDNLEDAAERAVRHAGAIA